MGKAGVSEPAIMKMTGHRSRAMFDKYNTVDREDAQNALNKLDDFLASSKIVQKGQNALTPTSVNA
jgi:hypothetical protein